MNSQSASSAEINVRLQRLRRGDAGAREEVIRAAQSRLIRLARKMLADFPGVRRWEETDDVFQNALIRLCRSLDHVVPDSAAGLLRLAARDIRCALIDLARHYGGPLGHGAHHGSVGEQSSIAGAAVEPADDTHEPTTLAYWSEFHSMVQALPDDQQEVVDLLWYQGLSQQEAAEFLAVSDRTIQRRWRRACLTLHEALHGLPP